MRAALESTCYQTRDLVEAIGDDAVTPTEMRVDGGMVANDWVCRCLADVLQMPVARPGVIETTALGAAYLAGLQVRVYDSLAEIGALWQAQQTFAPQREAAAMQGLYEGWLAAVQRVRSG